MGHHHHRQQLDCNRMKISSSSLIINLLVVVIILLCCFEVKGFVYLVPPPRTLSSSNQQYCTRSITLSTPSSFTTVTRTRTTKLRADVSSSTEEEENQNEPDVVVNNEKEELKRSLVPNIIKSTAGKAATRVKQLTQKGTSDVRSVATSTTSKIAHLAGTGGSGMTSALGATPARLSKIAGKGSSDVQSVATSAVSGISGLAERGSSGMKGIASRGVSDVVSMAGEVRTLAESGVANAGEIVQWMDAQAKGGVTVVNSKTQNLILSFTGRKEYRVGDITKELLRRIASAEYNLTDMILLLKVLLTIGASFGPLAKAIPVTVLLELLNVSLEKQIGGKIIETLAMSLDDRFTAALFTGDDKYQLGDLTKRSLAGAILNFTGKESYERGDIERAVKDEDDDEQQEDETIKEVEESKLPTRTIESTPLDVMTTNSVSDLDDTTTTIVSTSPGTSLPTTSKRLEIRISPEFEEWDRLFRESYPDLDVAVAESLTVIETTVEESTSSIKDSIPKQVTPATVTTSMNYDDISSKMFLDTKIAMELEEWDKMFLEKYPDGKSIAAEHNDGRI